MRMRSASEVMAYSLEHFRKRVRDFIHDHGFFAHAVSYFDAGGYGFVGGETRADYLDHVLSGPFIEKAHADAALAGDNDVGEIADGKRRSVAGKDSIGLGEFVEDGEKLQLHFEFVGNGFDDEVGVADGFVDDARGGD